MVVYSVLFFIPFFFLTLFVVLASNDEGGEIFSAKSQVLCINCHSKLHFFVYIRCFKSLINAILDM